MKLSVKDRVILAGILPAEGDLRTMRTIMKLRESIFFTEEEVKLFEITQDGPQVFWEATKAKDVEIHVGDIAKEVIIDALKGLDEEKKLTVEHMELCEKFLPEAGSA